jgi:hypothetical protein
MYVIYISWHLHGLIQAQICTKSHYLCTSKYIESHQYVLIGALENPPKAPKNGICHWPTPVPKAAVIATTGAPLLPPPAKFPKLCSTLPLPPCHYHPALLKRLAWDLDPAHYSKAAGGHRSMPTAPWIPICSYVFYDVPFHAMVSKGPQNSPQKSILNTMLCCAADLPNPDLLWARVPSSRQNTK